MMQNNNAYLQNLQQMFNTIKNNPNSRALMQNFIKQNPYYKQAVNLVQQVGNPEQVVRMLAQQKGIDPNQILNMIKNS